MCIYNINLDLAICYASKIRDIPWNSDIFTFDDHTISSLQGSSLILTSHVIQMFEQPANTS